MSQSASTPPPSPPSAAMRIVIGRTGSALWFASAFASVLVFMLSRRPYAGASHPITVDRRRCISRSHTLGFCTISARKNDGHNTAACATSPQRPQPTHPLLTCATGSVRSGSEEALIVSDGPPEGREAEG